jgi:predicted kinase
MAALHFFCGKAGAGKTTAARKLARETGAILICEDEWLEKIADPIADLEAYVLAAARIRSVTAPLAADLLRLGVSVVFDFGGNTVGDRDWVRAIFTRAEAQHTLHYMRTDDRTCRRRIQRRNETQPEGLFFGVVTEAQVDEVNVHFRPPDASEGFTVVVHDEPIELAPG